MNPTSTSFFGAVSASTELTRPVAQKGTVSLAHLLPASINPTRRKSFQRFVQNDWSSGTRRVNTSLRDATIRLGIIYDRSRNSGQALSRESGEGRQYTERTPRFSMELGGLVIREVNGMSCEGRDEVTKKKVILRIFMGQNAQSDAERDLNSIRPWLGFRNVVSLKGTFKSSCIEFFQANYLVLVMPIVRPNLENLLFCQGRMEFLDSLYLLKALLETHLDASKEGWIHDDISPSNLSWDNRQLTVFGFAFAKKNDGFKDKEKYSTERMFYRAPEALMGKRYGPSVDLWSIGCIIFRAFTGTHFVTPSSNSKIGCKVIMGSIAKRIGLPSSSFFEVENSSVAESVCSKEEIEQEMRVSILPSFSYEIEGQCSKRKIPNEIAQPFSQLLQLILRYENRISPDEALAECSRLIAGLSSDSEEKKQMFSIQI